MDKSNSLVITAIALMMAASCVLLGSCGKSRKDQAAEIYQQAEEAYQRGEWDDALTMLGYIDSLYKGELDVRRQARHLRPQIIEKQALERLSIVDSMLAVTAWIGDSLQKNFRQVNNSLERYYVTKNSPADINTRPGLYARMSPDGVLYFVAVSPGVRADKIILNGQETKAIPHDGERNDQINGNQVLTFLEGEIGDVVLAIANSIDSPGQLQFIDRGNVTGRLTLSAADMRDLSTACQTAVNLRNFKLRTLEKERLERTITVARNQTARTMPDPE